jgi:hypothetical protein
MGNEDAEEEERAGNADEGKEEVKCLFYGRFVRSPDGTEIDQNTETQSEEKTERLDHADMIANFRMPVNYAVAALPIRIFYLTVLRLSINIQSGYEARQ